MGITKPSKEYQLRYALQSKRLYSKVLRWGKKGHTQRRIYNECLSKAVEMIVTDHLQDNMKAPMNCDAQSALVDSKASFNIYFGENKGDPGRDLQIVVRAAYATESGARSIGLDPRHATLNYIGPTLSRLRDVVQRRMQEQFPGMNCKFNHVSIKIYYKNKKTGEHTDISYNDDHTAPLKENSQIPGTPVGIVSFGDPKYLKFTEFWGKGKGKRVKFPEKTVTFLQENRSLIAFDPRDEDLNWRQTWWKHQSQLVNPNNGVTVSLMFRVVQSEVSVYSDTGKLVDPIVPGGEDGKKIVQLDTGHEEQEADPDYPENRQAVLDHIRSTLAPYF